jgi:hypothetical protein
LLLVLLLLMLMLLVLLLRLHVHWLLFLSSLLRGGVEAGGPVAAAATAAA